MWAVVALLFGQGELSVWGSVVSLLSCLLAYEVARMIFRNIAETGQRFSWQMVMTMGMFSSLMNAIGLTLLQAQRPDVTMMKVYVIGNMLGLASLMLGLMVYFRWADQRRA